MTNLVERVYGWLSFVPRISLRNLLEIAIITFLVYEILVWIKNTRAWTLLKGIVVILGFTVFAYVLRLDTILWIISNFAFVATTALIIIFQPELRKALEELGSQNLISGILSFDDRKINSEFTERTVNEIVKATFEMAKVKTGALIVVEQAIRLTEYESTGIYMDCIVSSQVLINIFEHNTPLHDGAIIVRENRIVSATCYLPLSDNMEISKELGTRHRAALGMSEVSDALIIAVSEETGYVSVAQGGQLVRNVTPEYLKESLIKIQTKNTEKKIAKLWKGRRKHEKETD